MWWKQESKTRIHACNMLKHVCQVMKQKTKYNKMCSVCLAADSTEMPSIEIMAFTSSDNLDSTVTLQCTLSGFAPSQVNMYWLIGSRRENGQTLFVWDEGKENSVKTQNYVMISEEEWKTGGEGTCVVKLGGRTFTKTLNYDGKLLFNINPLIANEICYFLCTI